MNDQKFQSGGTVYCDGTKAYKYPIIEEFGEQNAELLARWDWLKNDYADLYFLTVESVTEGSELVFMVGFMKLVLIRVEKTFKILNKLIVFINWIYKYFTHRQSLSLLFEPLRRK
jgi:hypothetical protein